MSGKFLRFLLRKSVILLAFSLAHSENLAEYFRKNHRQNFSLLIDFTCATARDELEKHPEMRTIAMVELENNFPHGFSRQVLKCLPQDVAKVNLNPHDQNSTKLPKESMVILIADKAQKILTSHHLSKHLIVSSDKSKIQGSDQIFLELVNAVQIYEESRKVAAKFYDWIEDLDVFKKFVNSNFENVSQIIFPDKTKNLNENFLYAVWMRGGLNTQHFNRSNVPNCMWNYFLNIVAEKLNATLKFKSFPSNNTSWKVYYRNEKQWLQNFTSEEKLDFYLNNEHRRSDLQSYNNIELCMLAPLPDPYSITEQILFLPLDKSCWMWLGITIAISTLLWRISGGHWNFFFGVFAYFVGQSAEIRTSRWILKIILQVWILTIFIFSNGYQSLVTSFMLNPVHQKLLKSVDEVLDSNLNIGRNELFIDVHQENPKLQNALKDGRIKIYNDANYKWTQLMVEKKYAKPQSCTFNKNRIKIKGDGKSWQGIYLIPEVAYSSPYDLYVKPMHPYLDKFQELMDRSFEAGLPIAWERFFFEIFQATGTNKTEEESKKKTLDFNLIVPFFLILAFGFAGAVVILFCEIFYHDAIQELTKEYFERKFNEIIRREIKIEDIKVKQEIKVKRIQVKPVRRNSRQN